MKKPNEDPIVFSQIIPGMLIVTNDNTINMIKGRPYDKMKENNQLNRLICSNHSV